MQLYSKFKTILGVRKQGLCNGEPEGPRREKARLGQSKSSLGLLLELLAKNSLFIWDQIILGLLMVNFYSKIKILFKKINPRSRISITYVQYGVTLAARISDICEDSAMVGKKGCHSSQV